MSCLGEHTKVARLMQDFTGCAEDATPKAGLIQKKRQPKRAGKKAPSPTKRQAA